MKIKFGFWGGSDNGEGINYVMPEPYGIDAEAQAFLDDWDAKHDEDMPELYEERPWGLDDHECAGYDEMVDAMADKLRLIGFPLECVEWYYGSNADGTPAHYFDPAFLPKWREEYLHYLERYFDLTSRAEDGEPKAVEEDDPEAHWSATTYADMIATMRKAIAIAESEA